MKHRRRAAARTAVRAAVAALLAPALLAPALATPAFADPAVDPAVPGGWIRLAHLSPGSQPCDVYLYPFGGSTAQVVLKHVAYGHASPYEALPPGLYLVAMRDAGAASTSPPVISTQVQVQAGQAYTVAGLGPAGGLTLKVLDDQLDPPAGRASVRVIEASLDNPAVTITAAGGVIDANVHFPSVTAYATVPGGATVVRVNAANKSASADLSFAAGSTYTLAVLDGTGGRPSILELNDAGGERAVPQGGVQTGLGGAAQDGPATAATESTWSLGDVQWAALLLAGAGTDAVALRRLRRG